MTFQAGKGCLPTIASLRSKALQASALLWQQYGRLQWGRSMWLMLQLEKACVMPAGQSACGVWGVLPLRGAAREARAALAALHLQHLKKLVGLRQSVPTPNLLSELRQSEMSDVWLLRAAGFWRSTVASPGMHQQIALDAVQLAVSGVRSGLAAGLVPSLRVVGYEMSLVAGSLPEIDITQLRHNLRTCRDEVWQELHVSPRLASSTNARLCTYYRWFQPFAQAATILRLPIHTAMRHLLLFRTGCHGLAVDLGRGNGIESRTVLRLCGACPEDEMHLVFKCAALQMLRDNMPTQFQGVHSKRCFVWQDNMMLMSRFVRDAMRMVRAASSGDELDV